MTIRELRAGSVFKLVFLSALSCFIVIGVIFGLLALGGANTVNMNGRPVHGIAALPISLLLSLMMSLVFSAFATAGFLLLRLIVPRLTVETSAPAVEEA